MAPRNSDSNRAASIRTARPSPPTTGNTPRAASAYACERLTPSRLATSDTRNVLHDAPSWKLSETLDTPSSVEHGQDGQAALGQKSRMGTLKGFGAGFGRGDSPVSLPGVSGTGRRCGRGLSSRVGGWARFHRSFHDRCRRGGKADAVRHHGHGDPFPTTDAAPGGWRPSRVRFWSLSRPRAVAVYGFGVAVKRVTPGTPGTPDGTVRLEVFA